MDPQRDGRATVVIIDDDPALRDALLSLLTVSGFPIREYESSEAFLGDPEAFDHLGCLLVDQHLTGMSGVDLLRHLSETRRLPPAILFSARLTERIINDARAAGALVALDKPVRPVTLISYLRAAMG